MSEQKPLQKPLMVVALGGNALSPPDADGGYTTERRSVARAASVLARLLDAGYRLLLVPGNGPQVGRLMQSAPSASPDGSVNMDIHVAQTQGELGYLLSAAIGNLRQSERCVCVVTRAVVCGGLGEPEKPVGPTVPNPPAAGRSRRAGAGWRLLVPSPRPERVLELDAVRGLLATHHVIAGGGGGVPVAADGTPLDCVIDKDWIAGLFAVALEADTLLFATNVDGVYRDFGAASAQMIGEMSVSEARKHAAQGMFERGSMAPKVAAAADFAEATGRRAGICTVAEIDAAARGEAGTRIVPHR